MLDKSRCGSLKYHLNVKPKNIFCTKLASKIARTASSFHGYKDLVKELCGKDISKKEQQSDWGDPNLSEKQIKYVHLILNIFLK